MAQKGINKVILIGNLGKDPDIRYTPNGTAIANLSVATSESWIDKNSGQKQEKTEWHRVVVFGKPAEIIQQYASKGGKIYIEGKLQTRKWQDQQGQDRYQTEVVVEDYSGRMQLLSGTPTTTAPQPPRQQNEPAPQQRQQAAYQQQQQQPQQQRQNTQQQWAGGGYNDDIPMMRIQYPYLM